PRLRISTLSLHDALPILLIGLVKKNAIMMIDFALDAQRRQGMRPHDAIRQAALLRFRPILMTTVAALFGAIPLMLSTGSGAELRSEEHTSELQSRENLVC